MVPIGDEAGQTQLVLLDKKSKSASKLLAHMKKTVADEKSALKKTEKAIKEGNISEALKDVKTA
jgi:hypothetical protein